MQRISDVFRTSLKTKRATIILVLSCIVLFFWFISIALAPLNKMRELHRLVYSDSVFSGSFDSIYNQSELSKLVTEKAYKEALLKLADSDSIQLVIDLADSTVYLSIKGVVLHRTKVNTIERDKFFDRVKVIEQVKLFSQPLAIHKQYATIIKEPVVVRNAPKDTIEASLNAWEPDTLIQNPAFVLLSLDFGIHLILTQDSNPAFKDKWQKFIFYTQLGIQKFSRSLFHFILLKKQEYYPAIVIKMPVDDLREIYRALPQKAFAVINI